MNIEMWPIDRPKDYPRNTRKWSAQALAKVGASIKAYGWRQPVVVDSKEVIIIGHLRRAAGKAEGFTECPVHVARDLTPAQTRGLRLADNRTNQESDWDLELLAAEFRELQALGFDLSLTAFDTLEIDQFTLSVNAAEDQVPPVPEVPVTRPGDLWLMGGHRLLCADSTSAEAVARLMGREKSDMVFIDPPYNTDYEGYTEEHLTIQNDRMSGSEFKQFLEAVFRSCRAAIKPGASLYVCHSSSWQREFQNALEAAGFEVRCQIIWAKDTFAWGFGRYKFQHEPIFYCHVVGQSDAWYGNKSQSTLWQENKPAASRLHPTMKPVELVERALVNSSNSGDICTDFCAGAGSTLIACERRSRKARLIELDPKYADVIVQRWENLTGKSATLKGDGSTFERVKSLRRLEIQGNRRKKHREAR
jgi:DNA modification methylase